MFVCFLKIGDILLSALDGTEVAALSFKMIHYNGQFEVINGNKSNLLRLKQFYHKFKSEFIIRLALLHCCYSWWLAGDS